MENKRNYILAEMLVAYRREYIKAYSILKKMKECIKVDSSVYTGKKEPFQSFQYDIGLSLESIAGYIITGNTTAEIDLVIRKKGPLTTYRDIKTRNCGLYDIDGNTYHMDLSKDTNYSFDSHNNKEYVDRITVLEEKRQEYNTLFHQLQQLDICNTLSATCGSAIKIANHSIFSIDELGLEYKYIQTNSKIIYDAKSDQIVFQTKGFKSLYDYNYNKSIIMNLLGTIIPSTGLLAKYNGIIEKSQVDLDSINIIGQLRRNDSLSIVEEDGKKLVLTRGKK